MISVIICTRNKALLEAITSNIAQTIGVAYELIAVDNAKNQFGIAAAYNTCASQASFNCLCFVHEDVKFHTENWGRKVLTHFEADAAIGLIAIAGGSYKAIAPSSWFPPIKIAPEFSVHKYLIQHYPSGVQTENVNPSKEIRTRVACVDGVWVCCKKEIWEQVRFDEKLPRFHGYDIDFSLGVNQIAHVYVVYDILLEHFSSGKYDAWWMRATYQLHQKWNKHLPVNYTSASDKLIFSLETKSRNQAIKLMKHGRFKPFEILNVIWGMGSLQFFNVLKMGRWNIQWLGYTAHYYVSGLLRLMR